VRAARTVPPLIAGILIIDLVLNAAVFDPASPLGSLLPPSLDAMLLLATLVLIAQAGTRTRLWLRIGLVVPSLLMIAAAAATGPGPVAVFLTARVALAILALAAAGALCFLAFDLVIRGLDSALFRNVFLLAVSFLAILQITSRLPIFRQSAAALLIGQLLRQGRTG
jgi:hypothetical protein